MVEKKVSIVIPTYNRRYSLKACIESIYNQSYSNLEVIVFDNGSTDGTRGMLSQRFPQVKVLINDVNIGPGRSRNQALEKATGEYIWFLDSDCIILNRDCLKRMSSVLDADARVAVVGGEINERGNMLTDVFGYATRLNGRPKEVFISRDSDVEMIECDYIATANFLVRRKAFEEVGGFDPAFSFSCEDQDICFKLKERTYKVVIHKGAELLHRRSKTASFRDIIESNLSRLHFALKHFSLARLIVLPILDCAYYLELFIRNYRVFRTRRIGDMDHMPQRTKARLTKLQDIGLVKLLIVASTIGWALLSAYIYAVRNFSAIRRARF